MASTDAAWEYEFNAEVKAGGKGGAYVDFPYDVQKEFGARGRVPIKCTIGGIPYRGSLAKLGGPCHILIVRKQIRDELGVEIGDVVSVVLQRDATERKVVVPAELQRTLAADPVARRTFASNSTSHQREFAEWVAEAKKPETRERRAAKAVEMLRAGQTRS